MRKNILQILLILLVVSLVSGVFAQEEPRYGGDLIISLGSDPEHLNPALSTGYPIAAATADVYSALVWRDEEGEYRPDLAKSWEVSDDYLTYTFHLRDNVYWHDGEHFTSGDVKFSMEELLADFHGRFDTAFQHVESITTPDDYTVIITLKSPYAPLLSLLTVFDAPILPQHLFADGNPFENPHTNNPIGTGPFQFKEWSRGDRIVLERFDNYFEDPAYLDRVIFRIIPDEPARTIAMETGEVDYTLGFYLPVADLDRLRNMPTLEYWQGIRIPALFFVFINTDHPELGDVRVRQAIMHAIDRELLVDLAYDGLGHIGIGPLGAAFPMVYSENADVGKLYPYDPAKAKSLLAEAGVSNLELNIIFDSGRPAFKDSIEIMRSNLADVGITLTLEPMERSVMVERVYEERSYALSMQSFTSGGDPAIGYHRIYASAKLGDMFVNATGYSNETVDRLFSVAAEVPTTEARAELYQEAVEILAADVPVLILFEEEAVEVNNKDLRGLRQSLDVRDQMHRVWWAK